MSPNCVKIEASRVPKAQMTMRTGHPFRFDYIVVVLVAVFVQIQHIFVATSTKIAGKFT